MAAMMLMSVVLIAMLCAVAYPLAVYALPFMLGFLTETDGPFTQAKGRAPEMADACFAVEPMVRFHGSSGEEVAAAVRQNLKDGA